ncbi:uncharacterized protein LOC135693129 [Rhopilema esculentum]|uniref:uncharacterized protein LOC135693129 n=1 Tax=Rhopilema esculentum TaxID=499914 RepID=UPI0031DEFDF8
MIYEDQNDTSGMQKVMTKLHDYAPCNDSTNPTEFVEQGVVGDQLTVERGVSCLLQLANGFTQKERLDGLHLEVADFHAGMKFLQVAFDHLYSPKSSSDKCTMFADKVFINRRNVRSDVSQKVEGCKQFFILEVTARVLAAYCEILGIKDVDDEPDQNTVLDNVSMMSIKEKKELLDSLSAKVVDNFIIRKERNAGIVNRQIYEDWLLATNVKDDDGMYLCRKHGCLQTFKFDGKRRIEHEKMHGLHKKAPNTSAIVKDDMFNYQCALLDIGMVLMNFFDAVSEGDGLRVVRCWKFMLLYMKQDGARSRKYALEGLYLLFQVYAILSERDAHSLIWNRFSKSRHGRGGNIPLDLAMEHYNNLLKSVIRNLGPNATNTRAVDRFCKALTVNKKMLENFDSSCNVLRRSGKHIKANISGDLKKIVGELIKNSALQVIPGRKYSSYAGVKPSLLEDFDIHAMYKWIQDHKSLAKLNKAGR